MKQFKIEYIDDVIQAENEREAYVILLNRLREFVEYEDITCFEFKETK